MRVILPALSALALSYALAPVMLLLAKKFRFYDSPNERKVHTEPKPYLGGGAIFLAFNIVCLLFFPWNSELFIFLGGGAFFFILGLLDDKYDLPARLRLGLELAATTVVVWLGMRAGLLLENPFGGIAYNSIFIWFSIPFSVLWIVGIANAVNFIDGLDALAAGTILIAAAALSAAAWLNPAIILSPLLLVLIGSIAGFIRYNLYPSKIIMGDSGALFLGYTIAFISLSSFASSDRSIFLSLIPPAMALYVPILDTLVAIIRRGRNGRRIFAADKSHFHHLLMDRGHSHPKAVRIIWSICVGFGAVSLILSRLIYRQSYLALALLALVSAWAIYSAASIGMMAKGVKAAPVDQTAAGKEQGISGSQ